MFQLRTGVRAKTVRIDLFLYIHTFYMRTLHEVYNKKTPAFWVTNMYNASSRSHEKLILFAYGWLIL